MFYMQQVFLQKQENGTEINSLMDCSAEEKLPVLSGQHGKSQQCLRLLFGELVAIEELFGEVTLQGRWAVKCCTVHLTQRGSLISLTNNLSIFKSGSN